MDFTPHRHFSLIFRRDGADIKQAEAHKLIKIRNAPSALVCHDTTFVDTMKALAN